MDCAFGGDLGNYMKEFPKGCMPEQEAMRIFRQVHDAVRYIHGKGVVHRDIKPDNILFLDKKKENVVVILQ